MYHFNILIFTHNESVTHMNAHPALHVSEAVFFRWERSSVVIHVALPIKTACRISGLVYKGPDLPILLPMLHMQTYSRYIAMIDLSSLWANMYLLTLVLILVLCVKFLYCSLSIHALVQNIRLIITVHIVLQVSKRSWLKCRLFTWHKKDKNSVLRKLNAHFFGLFFHNSASHCLSMLW